MFQGIKGAQSIRSAQPTPFFETKSSTAVTGSVGTVREKVTLKRPRHAMRRGKRSVPWFGREEARYLFLPLHHVLRPVREEASLGCSLFRPVYTPCVCGLRSV